MAERILFLAPADIVLKRVAAELGAAAADLAAVEAHVAALVGHGLSDHADAENLQALDRVNQQLRVLEAFLYAAAPLAQERMDLTDALHRVWLDGVRDRLAGHAPSCEPAPVPEFW
jgi:hypothetical protein